VYLILKGQTGPALSTALCVVAALIAVVAQALGASRRHGGT
jgi:hypothetical protein